MNFEDGAPVTQTATRIEKDSMGEMSVPADVLYGATTQRALLNFPIKELPVSWEVIHAFALLKKSAAQANHALGKMEEPICTLICAACDEISQALEDSSRRGDMMRHFPVDVFQTGSGTSTNMNVNEVISNLACLSAGAEIGAQDPVHPNDHVNMGQSSNDTFPTAMHVSSCIRMTDGLLPALEVLGKSLENKADQFEHLVKIGRTHLQDATPIRLGQEFSGFARQLKNALVRTRASIDCLAGNLAIGGTAVGTGINTQPDFAATACRHLNQLTGLRFMPADNYFAAISSQDTAVEVSGHLNTLAVSLMKICNDLRWMNSGPLTGLGEIALDKLQAGSSIMPGKVNPVIPEALAMVCAQVMGYHQSITIAGQSGNFQLNTMLPLVGYNLLTSISILSNGINALTHKAIVTMRANSDRMAESISMNPILVTALNSRVGYEKGALIAKAAYEEKRPVIDIATQMTDIPREELEKLLAPKSMT